MIDDLSISLVEFTPAEIGRASGLSVDLQRVWRRRGQLPDRQGHHARFNVFDVASIMVRYALSRRGVTPTDSIDLGTLAAPSVVWCALMHADGVCEVRGEPGVVEEFEAAYFEDATLINRLAGVSQGDVYRYLVAFDGESPVLDNDIGLMIEGAGAESGFFISLDILGMRLVDRIGKPLMVVQIGPEPKTAAQRRQQVRRLMWSRAARQKG